MVIIAILLNQVNGGNENIFYAGQNISGQVRVETKDELKMRGIRIEVHGDSRVHWSEGSNEHRREYTCIETLLDFNTYLTGSDKNSEMILKSGVHTFPLNFLLPNTVPSSFAGTFGYIKYRLKAVVNRIHRLDDTTEIPLTVIRVLDLNNEALEVKAPIVVQEHEPMKGCCATCCCVKGLPEIELRMSRGCYVPGETMTLSGRVANKTNTNIKKTLINFMQETEYIVMNKSGVVLARKHQLKVLETKKRSKIKSGKDDSWTDVTFTVPKVPASRLDGSNIINITYFIQVKVDFANGCCCADSGIRHDIIIGNVPLRLDSQFPAAPVTAQPSVFASPFQFGTTPAQDPSSHSGVHGGGAWN